MPVYSLRPDTRSAAPRSGARATRTGPLTCRWGILGTGALATRVATDLAILPGHRTVAIGSRSPAGAEASGSRHGIPNRHGSYEALVHDDEVDVVHIATPHSLHRDHTLLALDAGKPVLCEKPFAIHAGEAREMIDRARDRRLFLMEAMWTRFLPAVARTRQLVRDGAIGTPRLLSADFGFREEVDPTSILFDPAAGGGSLLDVGVYPLSLASMLLGRPDRIEAVAHLGATGVDESCAFVLHHPDGAIAVGQSSIVAGTPQRASVSGTRGRIVLHPPWWSATRLTLEVEGEAPREIELPVVGHGYGPQADAVASALRENRLEDDRMPLDETLAIQETLDAIRTRCGLVYPMDP